MNLSPDSLGPDGTDVSFLYMAPFPIAEFCLLASTAYIMSAAAFPYASIFTRTL